MLQTLQEMKPPNGSWKFPLGLGKTPQATKVQEHAIQHRCPSTSITTWDLLHGIGEHSARGWQNAGNHAVLSFPKDPELKVVKLQRKLRLTLWRVDLF